MTATIEATPAAVREFLGHGVQCLDPICQPIVTDAQGVSAGNAHRWIARLPP